MLCVNRKKRPSAAELLDHPFLKKKAAIETTADTQDAVIMNLKNFQAHTTLQQSIMTYLVSQFASSAQKNKLAKIFKEFDKNGDGRLDK